MQSGLNQVFEMSRKRSTINLYNIILINKLSFILLFISSIQLTAKDVPILGSTENDKLPVLARDFTIPESWQLLSAAQDGEITQFSIRGDWLTWIEKRLDPTTVRDRARSYFTGLYRKRIDSNEIETLRAPDYSNTWGDHFVPGDNGIVSYDYRGAYSQTLYVPGQKPFALYNGDSYAGTDTPIQIFQDAMLCVSQKRICLIPFAGKLPDLKRRIRLDILKKYDASKTVLFRDGKHILYTQEKRVRIPSTKKFRDSLSINEINLYDIESGKTIWKDKRIYPEIIQALGLNNEYIYYYVKCQHYKLNSAEKIFRRALKEPGKVEQIILQFHLPYLTYVPYIADFGSERLLCLIRRKYKNRVRCFAAEIDFKIGTLSTFDIPLSLVDERYDDVMGELSDVAVVKGTTNWPPRSYYYIAPNTLYMTGDAKYSRLIAVFNDRIYLVPKIKTEKRSGLVWRPADK